MALTWDGPQNPNFEQHIPVRDNNRLSNVEAWQRSVRTVWTASGAPVRGAVTTNVDPAEVVRAGIDERRRRPVHTLSDVHVEQPTGTADQKRSDHSERRLHRSPTSPLQIEMKPAVSGSHTCSRAQGHKTRVRGTLPDNLARVNAERATAPFLFGPRGR